MTISYNGHVRTEDIRRCLANVSDSLNRLNPGFILLSDLTHLESMEAACAPEIGALMDLCSAKGMSRVVRVIPDPSKDIGFDLMSHFHLRPSIRTQTHSTLADAIKSLLAEDHSPDRTAEDNRAEAHFTTASRKDAEVNEGGLVEINEL